MFSTITIIIANPESITSQRFKDILDCSILPQISSNLPF
uniref:Uncharacterized protein n=1 Tax=viral metagenome TaxID=1070528 RepID=A0A6C0BM53_9ZZZZ